MHIDTLIDKLSAVAKQHGNIRVMAPDPLSTEGFQVTPDIGVAVTATVATANEESTTIAIVVARPDHLVLASPDQAATDEHVKDMFV